MPLSLEELKEAILKRIKNSAMSGEIPFDPELINNLYLSTRGNFRETLGLMELLANHADSNEMIVTKISMRDCREYFFNIKKDELESMAKKEGELTNKGKIIKALTNSRTLSLGEISSITEIK